MEEKRLVYLITRYTQDGLSASEEAEFMNYVMYESNSNALQNLMELAWDDDQDPLIMNREKADDIFNKVIQTVKDEGNRDEV